MRRNKPLLRLINRSRTGGQSRRAEKPDPQEQSAKALRGLIPRLIFRYFSEIDCVILEVSVGMHAPFAPHMSCGSRAIQAKPEGDCILFRAQEMKQTGDVSFVRAGLAFPVDSCGRAASGADK